MAAATIILALIVVIVTGSSTAKKVKNEYIPLKVEMKESTQDHPLQLFSHDEIKEFDGSDPSKPIYMAVKGVVFDVSSGKNFYGKGSTYNDLVGRDCTRAVAKMSLDPEDLTHETYGLTDAQLKDLDETYTGTYLKKYPVVGYMIYLMSNDDITKFIIDAEQGEDDHDKEMGELLNHPDL